MYSSLTQGFWQILLSPGQLSSRISSALHCLQDHWGRGKNYTVESHKSKYIFLPLPLIFHWSRQVTGRCQDLGLGSGWTLENSEKREPEILRSSCNIYIGKNHYQTPSNGKSTVFYKNTKSQENWWKYTRERIQRQKYTSSDFRKHSWGIIFLVQMFYFYFRKQNQMDYYIEGESKMGEDISKIWIKN